MFFYILNSLQVAPSGAVAVADVFISAISFVYLSTNDTLCPHYVISFIGEIQKINLIKTKGNRLTDTENKPVGRWKGGGAK